MPHSIGGHALVALSSGIMTVQFFTTTQGRRWVAKLMDREPIVFFSCLLGTVGVAYVPPPPRPVAPHKPTSGFNLLHRNL